MSRYLTPAKIGLLTLLELYTDGAVPNSAIIPVLSFITSHILDGEIPDLSTSSARAAPDRWGKVDSTVNLRVAIRDFEKLLSPIQSNIGLPGRRLWDKFLDKVWGIDSLYALHDFFDGRLALLERTQHDIRQLGLEQDAMPPDAISRNSPLGMFLRQSHVEFTRLPFHDAAELWKAFVQYRQPTSRQWKKRPRKFGRLSFDHVLVDGQKEWGDNLQDVALVPYADVLLTDQGAALPVSTDELEVLLEFQIRQMQQFGHRVPPATRDKLQSLMGAHSAVPSLSHYLSFLDAWRSGDYTASFDCLYRYFDYTMRSRDRTFYQYALMNLAILQSDFGCHREAVSAMRESVSVARENRDMTCLNFALNWLFHFGRAHPELVKELESNSTLGNGGESLAFLRVKARETHNWALWSSALLSEAKMGLSQGDSIAGALECVVRSSQATMRQSTQNMVGAQFSMVVAIWDRFGLARMSEMACQVFLYCHAKHSVFDDEVKMVCRLAGLQAAKGRYDYAFKTLEAVMNTNPMRSWKPNQYWHKYRGLLKLRRDLHRGNLNAADTLLAQLLQSRPDDLDPDMVLLVDMLHIEALTRRGDLSAAFVKVEQSIADLRENNRDIALRVSLLLHKADLFDRAGRPQKGFTIIMRAASMAWRARLMPLLWQAVGALANVLTSLGEFDAAARLLRAVIPRCLECNTVSMSAPLVSLLADTYVGRAGRLRGPGASAQRNELLTRARRLIDYAYTHFRAAEDVDKQCEMLAKRMAVMRAAGNGEMAKRYAPNYLRTRRTADTRNGFM